MVTLNTKNQLDPLGRLRFSYATHHHHIHARSAKANLLVYIALLKLDEYQ